jgi:LacI family transcriptional regulator
VGSNADAVCSDHAAGMTEALSHLASLGHRRVALVAGSVGQLGSRARILAYRRLAPRFGLDLDRRLVVSGELSRETGYLATRELLALAEPPTALIAGNNQLTVGALEALRDRGLRVPGDLSLIACDDVDLTRMHDPPIDVIDRNLEEHGRVAAELLLARLANASGPARRVTLPTRFLRRGSTAELVPRPEGARVR